MTIAAAAAGDRPRPFQVIDLGTLGFVHDPGGQLAGTADPSVPGTFDVNNHDQVAYARRIDHPEHGLVVRPFLFTLRGDYGVPGGEPRDMLDDFGPSGAVEGVAMDINDDGVVVGQLGGTTFFEGQAHVWILHPTDPALAQSISIPLPASTTWSRAVSVSEAAPWTVLVQTSVGERCPSACGPLDPLLPHVATFTVTVSSTGVVSAPVWLAGDADCRNTIAAWAVAPAADTFVGSDVELVDGACGGGSGSGCGDDTSGLRWSSATSVVMLEDFDATTSDVQPSEGRDVAADGTSVGWAVDAEASCFERAVVWDPAGIPAGPGGLDTLALAVDPSLTDVDDQLDDRSRTWAEGMNDRLLRTVVGWDADRSRTALWYETGLTSPAWEVMFPGSNVPAAGLDGFSPDSVVEGSCRISENIEAFLYHLYDVNDGDTVVGRGAVSELGFPSSDDLHLVLLVPQWGCTGDVDRDGDADLHDLLEVLGAWDVNGCDNCVWCPADLDGDRLVGFSDVVIVLGQWGECGGAQQGPPQSVQDCWERFGSDIEAFEACVQSLGGS